MPTCAPLKPKHASSGDDVFTRIKDLSVYFMDQSGWKLRYTPEDEVLRADIIHEIECWNAYGDHQAIEMLADTSCSIAEKAYALTSPEYRRFNALYTACCVHVDDIGNPVMVDAARKFGGRFARGEPQGVAALDTLAALLRDAYVLLTEVGADAVVSCTIDAMAAMGIEYTTQDMKIVPHATRWPAYFRARTGICASYAHLMFMRSWRETPESYLQLLPYLEDWIGSANDILSFYKEELEGETKNYICARAAAELLPPVDILRKLVDETLENGRRVEAIAAHDPELKSIWKGFQQGYLEFHVRTKRYRLHEMGI